MSITVAFFDISSEGPGGPITDWAWTFGDGGTSTDQNPIYDYTDPGIYSVHLAVTSPDGTSSVAKMVNVA